VQKSRHGKLFSASDLVNFAACGHLTHLDLINMETPLEKAADSEEMALIQGKGFEHEGAYLERLKVQHGEVVNLQKNGATDDEAFQDTVASLKSGAKVVFQATFLSPPFVGHADFLVRVDTPSNLGDFSYEIEDTKLARTVSAKFILQLCLYSEMLAEIQGVMPRHIHVVLGDGRKETFVLANYLRYYRQIKSRFLAWVSQQERESYPERRDQCDMCRWRERCKGQWESDDHLNRVAGISRVQIPRLIAAGVKTMHELALLTETTPVARIQPDTKNRLAHQARLQIQTLETDKPVFELLPQQPGKGFARMPVPADGDMYFDMEGNPLEDGGLEYLFGLYFFDAGKPVFKPFWAHSRTEEKKAFEAFIDFVVARLNKWPSAHVYHYAPYEPTALKRLMSYHGTREQEVDDLLREHKLVDLYAVVREGIRVGEPRYSIKYIEHFYSGARAGDVKNAGASIVFYEKWKANQDEALLKAIEDYNRDDVVSTFDLREWLRSIQPSDVPGAVVVDEPVKVEKPKSANALRAEAQMAAYKVRLVDDLPVDRLAWSDENRVSELLFQMLDFQRRADKPVWWALFARQDAMEDELIEDVEVIACLTHSNHPSSDGDGEGDGIRYKFTYPEQEFKLKTGSSCCIVSSLKDVEEVVIDEDKRQVSFVWKGSDEPSDGMSLTSGKPIPTYGIQAAYRRFVDAHLAGTGRFQAGVEFLSRALPKVIGHETGAPLVRPGENTLAATLRVVTGLDGSYLFVQGPPGAGKTYTGSHVIVELLRAGKRVAVASNSHKAINNLLEAVEKVAIEVGFRFKGAKKSSGAEQRLNGEFIHDISESKAIAEDVAQFSLVAGTAFLLASAGFEQKFDYLFVDEAGQVSVHNLMAMATCATNLVLLGDQMQLGQPIQGVHAGESGLSALDYLLRGEATIAPNAGVFLADTWRMHPDVCQFISDAVYDSRLVAVPENANQHLVLAADSHGALRPTGVVFHEVDHDACSQRSDVEADLIAEVIDSLRKQSYVNKKGETQAIGIENILVVAPFNQQVNLLKRKLPKGARVGTVDKFQGQEAEVVLVSMTTSSGEYLPRDIEFLYNKNRLNVAVSRAKSLAVVVANPKLLDVDCKTPEQMALVNTLCWIRDYSKMTSEVTE
jgi:predicted RecB family nuclease